LTMSSYFGNSLFPVYLLFASIANVVFLYFSIRDLQSPTTDKIASRALLALSVAELIWVVPCWLQCLAKWISDGGDHWWVPNASSYDEGCDVMGIYSVFASVSGMYLVGLIAYISYGTLVNNSKPTIFNTNMLIAGAYALAILQCLLPAVGIGSFKYSGEGFCYIDWSNAGQAICMEIVTVPIFVATCYWYVSCACYSELAEAEGVVSDRALLRAPPRWVWWMFLAAYVSAWVLWIPAIIIGLGSDKDYPDMFPTGYMIAGGASGHAQALINPYLYGVKWRTWIHGTEVIQDDEKEVTQDDEKVSAVLPEGTHAKASELEAPRSCASCEV